MPVQLEDLGARICVMGPSNAGKSTLACAIGARQGLPVVHLDRFRHLPGTDWVERPQAEFLALHAAALATERWVMDGNYSVCLAQRLERASGLIVLDAPLLLRLWRYVRRCWFERDRCGGLEGGRDSVKWAMLAFMIGPGRRNGARYRGLVGQGGLPALFLGSPGALAAFYRREGLR
ncbi:AAA family ATPase [Novosphingobium sp. 1949]|uniref:AAA family ATPase n=1 Tax=Novosphingobium organovorum TaxID=2930092 RepID=A0ABT0B8D2_9SPHN|nr:AAA family ATPase [Novosphingobium organovorum]MCJ2181330.1 AAA family ATPase [Novosphingobium organovorum]